MGKLTVDIAGYGVVGNRRRQYIDLNPHFELSAVSDQYYKSSFRDDLIFKEYKNSN